MATSRKIKICEHKQLDKGWAKELNLKCEQDINIDFKLKKEYKNK